MLWVTGLARLEVAVAEVFGAVPHVLRQARRLHQAARCALRRRNRGRRDGLHRRQATAHRVSRAAACADPGMGRRSRSSQSSSVPRERAKSTSRNVRPHGAARGLDRPRLTASGVRHHLVPVPLGGRPHHRPDLSAQYERFRDEITTTSNCSSSSSMLRAVNYVSRASLRSVIDHIGGDFESDQSVHAVVPGAAKTGRCYQRRSRPRWTAPSRRPGPRLDRTH